MRGRTTGTREDRDLAVLHSLERRHGIDQGGVGPATDHSLQPRGVAAHLNETCGRFIHAVFTHHQAGQLVR